LSRLDFLRKLILSVETQCRIRPNLRRLQSFDQTITSLQFRSKSSQLN